MTKSTFLRRGSARALLAGLIAAGLAAGAVSTPALAQKKKEQAAPAMKLTPSKGFMPAAVAAQKALADAKATPANAAAARPAIDAALAAATTPDDKMFAGQFALQLGTQTNDAALQRRGLVTMLDSGKVSAADAAKYAYYAGALAYDAKDYAGAAQYLRRSYDAGYRDAEGILMLKLADAYKRTGNSTAALALAQQDIAAAKAAGGKPSESSIRLALQQAYDSKQVGPATELSAELVRNYPSPTAWGASLSVVRSLGRYSGQEALDLMRLMDRTNSWTQGADYLEYVQSADPRRSPGEVLAILDKGVASGKLKAGDPFVSEARGIANGRVSADRASLVSLERDGRSGSASAVTTMAAADAFLSYGQAAKAAELYALALKKPGVDRDRALTRLGIAQLDSGDTAGAQATFAQVGGARKPLAELWRVYAQQKAGGRA